MKLEAVVQGQIYPNDTPRVIENLLNTTFVDRVVLSCWEDDPDIDTRDSRISVIKNPYPPVNRGIGNRNLQITSCRNGIAETRGDYVAKFRTDQIIKTHSLELMNRFYEKFKDSEVKYSDGSGPKSPIFVCGDFWPIPFHPRDHVYWSDRQSLVNLFDIPYDPIPRIEEERYNDFTRAEAYLGSFYYARFEERVKEMIQNPREFMTDNAPRRREAMEITERLRDKVFKVFPRIDLDWPKYNIYGYYYDRQAVWERWHDQQWE